MSVRHHRGLPFPFIEADPANSSPLGKESLVAHLEHGTFRGEINLHPFNPSTCTTGSKASIETCEDFASIRQLSKMSYLHDKFNSNADHVQHAMKIPLSAGYNWSCSSSSMAVGHLPACSSSNTGSLLLDASRGELINDMKMTAKEILEAKALAASRNHSEAERRRRERINTHLATLRTIIPSTAKSDKASLLAEVIDQVKNLKRQVSDFYCYGSFPSENDEIVVETDPNSERGRAEIKVSLSCDDRSDLLTDLKQTLETLKLHIIKVEMSTLGGRMKNNFTVAPIDESVEHNACSLVKGLQEALQLVVERQGRGELLQGKYSKRQRLMIVDGQADW